LTELYQSLLAVIRVGEQRKVTIEADVRRRVTKLWAAV